MVLSVLYDRGEFDGLRRRVLYAKAQKDENGCAQLYCYASDQSGSFASLEGSLATVSMHQISVLDETGKTVYDQSVKFQTPTLARSTARAAAYDVGGKTVYVRGAAPPGGCRRRGSCYPVIFYPLSRSSSYHTRVRYRPPGGAVGPASVRLPESRITGMSSGASLPSAA